MTTTMPRPQVDSASSGARPARGAKKSNRLLIWVFLAPTLIGLGIFSFIPIIGSVLLIRLATRERAMIG